MASHVDIDTALKERRVFEPSDPLGLRVAGGRDAIQLNEIQTNAPIEEAKFDRPMASTGQ
jgi:hypothetical protein